MRRREQLIVGELMVDGPVAVRKHLCVSASLRLKLLFLFQLFSISVFSFSSRGATITGALQNAQSAPLTNIIKFMPLSTPLADGPSLIAGPIQSTNITNGVLFLNLKAGLYHVSIGNNVRDVFRITVPGGSDTYNINDVISGGALVLATNLQTTFLDVTLTGTTIVNSNLTVIKTNIVGMLRMTNGATAGYIAVSDADGNFSWQPNVGGMASNAVANIGGLSTNLTNFAYFTLQGTNTFNGRTYATNLDAQQVGQLLSNTNQLITWSNVMVLLSTATGTGQPAHAGLTNISTLATNGIVVRDATNNFVARTITGTSSQIIVGNGNGVSGNPTLSLSAGINPNLLSAGDVSSAEFDFIDGLTANVQISLDTHTGLINALSAGKAANSNSVITNLTLRGTSALGGVITISNLTASLVGQLLSAAGTNDFLTYSNIQATISSQLSAGSATNAQPPAAALTNLSNFGPANGYVVRTSTNVFEPRSIVGTSGQIIVANGNGVSANTAISLSDGIDPALIAGGGVSVSEFNFLGSLTADAQLQLNSKVGNSNSFLTNITVYVQTNAGNILFSANNTYDIGTFAGNRPANLFLAGQINAGGNAIVADLTVGSGNKMNFNGRSVIESPADGRLTLFNAARTGFELLQFGGNADNSKPGIKPTLAGFMLTGSDGTPTTTNSLWIPGQLGVTNNFYSGATNFLRSYSSGAASIYEISHFGSLYFVGDSGSGIPLTQLALGPPSINNPAFKPSGAGVILQSADNTQNSSNSIIIPGSANVSQTSASGSAVVTNTLSVLGSATVPNLSVSHTNFQGYAMISNGLTVLGVLNTNTTLEFYDTNQTHYFGFGAPLVIQTNNVLWGFSNGLPGVIVAGSSGTANTNQAYTVRGTDAQFLTWGASGPTFSNVTFSSGGAAGAGVTNIPSAATITIDLSKTNTPIWSVTNPAAHNIAISIANPAPGRSFSFYIAGSGTATNNNLTWSGAAPMTLTWLGGTNELVVSNSFVFVSGTIVHTEPTTNLVIAVAGTNAGPSIAYVNSSVNGSSNSVLSTVAANLTSASNSLITTIDAKVSDTAFASSWNGVTTIGPSKNAVYDWAHLFDTDDDGKVNVLDIGSGIAITDSSGVLTAATASSDIAGKISDETGTGVMVFSAAPSLTGSVGMSGTVGISSVILTNGISRKDNLLLPTSLLTNYTLTVGAEANTINMTNAVRFTLLSGGAAGFKDNVSVTLTNNSGANQTLAFTNTWIGLGTVPTVVTNGKTAIIGFEIEGVWVRYGAVVQQ